MERDEPLFQILMLESAKTFLKTLPVAARNKILYNIRKVQGGVKDIELFLEVGKL